MKAGKLRQRIIIQKQTTIKSPSGAIKTTWSDLYNVFCSFEPLSVKDILTAQSNSSKITARIVIRKRTGIDSSMRIIYKGKTYEIEGNPLEDAFTGNDYLTIMVSIIE